MVIALNMMDVVEKNGDKIDVEKLSKILACPIVEISALKGKNIDKVIEAAQKAAGTKQNYIQQAFQRDVEKFITDIENSVSTIENENNRKMTIIVASFMPCGAKTEIIAFFAASIFAGSKGWWFAPVCYFSGILAVIISGIMLKKTRAFSGDPAPFVMELPEYHIPVASNVLRTVWDRVKAFIIKAGTIILLATIVIWFLQNISTNFEFVEFSSDSHSILETIGKAVAPIFTPVSALSFMLFNQLCIPCFAATGAMREEMNDKKWACFTLIYQSLFAYAIALMVYQFGSILVLKTAPTVWTFIAGVVLLFMLYMLFRKPKVVKVEAKRAVSI